MITNLSTMSITTSPGDSAMQQNRRSQAKVLAPQSGTALLASGETRAASRAASLNPCVVQSTSCTDAMHQGVIRPRSVASARSFDAGEAHERGFQSFGTRRDTLTRASFHNPKGQGAPIAEPKAPYSPPSPMPPKLSAASQAHPKRGIPLEPRRHSAPPALNPARYIHFNVGAVNDRVYYDDPEFFAHVTDDVMRKARQVVDETPSHKLFYGEYDAVQDRPKEPLYYPGRPASGYVVEHLNPTLTIVTPKKNMSRQKTLNLLYEIIDGKKLAPVRMTGLSIDQGRHRNKVLAALGVDTIVVHRKEHPESAAGVTSRFVSSDRSLPPPSVEAWVAPFRRRQQTNPV
jgi:hypothetical protein